MTTRTAPWPAFPSPNFRATPTGGRLAWCAAGHRKAIRFRSWSPPAPAPAPYHYATAALLLCNKTRKCKDLDYCTCDNSRKVPKREVTFLHDKRTVREMCIGNTDKQTSKSLTKTVARKMKSAACSSTFVPGPSTIDVESSMLSKSSEDSLCDRFEESDWNEVEFERISTPDTYKRISLSHTASAAFRTGVSERDVALIASAVLQDARLVTENKNLVVDKNKIRREKKKLGKQIQEKENLDGLKIKSVFFDGRRDKKLFIGTKRTSDIVDRKAKNISLCSLNLVLNIWDI
ncbi:hypothetical protein AVEN_237581-1 [Araneus ventricosus]|uniref:Uncharacterized protein n=1 Tax=Araneus ventricosus TaxID=182803 RepID=A0A4Y2SZZ9_ARAVE|nr:hypothetical protein AVEN_237581-1 [Araneus ventricosus]